jgi:hypothetical protein
MVNSEPVTAWKALKEGNERFVAGKPEHPCQGIERRASLAAAQEPTAVVFGCADSRVAAEIIFDQGLGDWDVPARRPTQRRTTPRRRRRPATAPRSAFTTATSPFFTP